MDDSQALHNALCRYCMERESEPWEQMDAEVARERDQHPTQQAFDTLLELQERWDVVAVILRRVEGVRPAAFPSVEALQIFLVETGTVASLWEGTRPFKEAAGMLVSSDEPSGEAERAGSDERKRFCAYVETVQPEDMHHIQPVTFRRLLSEREAERLWRRLRR